MLIQVYNSRSKKWVLLDDEEKGGIIKMRDKKFPGVPVKGANPEPPEEVDKETVSESKANDTATETKDEAGDTDTLYGLFG